MTTIASPRPSLTLSSRRTSTSTDTNTRDSLSTQSTAAPRRNRAALRQFYGLKSDANPESLDSQETLAAEDGVLESELDKHGFDADRYVRNLLDKDGLEATLRVEAGLLRDIRGIDGEKKALVYDNYSKLIGATDTIRKMRGNMDPLKPAFTTLTPAISHIAHTAEQLSSGKGRDSEQSEALFTKRKQQKAVQYVLDAPSRLRRLIDSSDVETAKLDWHKVSQMLDQWKQVPGTDEIRSQCEDVMRSSTIT